MDLQTALVGSLIESLHFRPGHLSYRNIFTFVATASKEVTVAKPIKIPIQKQGQFYNFSSSGSFRHVYGPDVSEQKKAAELEALEAEGNKRTKIAKTRQEPALTIFNSLYRGNIIG